MWVEAEIGGRGGKGQGRGGRGRGGSEAGEDGRRKERRNVGRRREWEVI